MTFVSPEGVTGRWSAVVVFWRNLEQLKACLAALDRALTGGDEIIIVDNRGDLDLLSLASQWSRVKLVSSGQNLVYGGGNNLGAECASRDFLFFVNPDVVVQPDCLQKLARALDSLPSLSLATPTLLLPNGLINTQGNHVTYAFLTYCRGLGRSLRDVGWHLVPAVSGAAFAARKADFQALGGFDKSFFMYLEDTDLSLRAIEQGGTCWCVADAIAMHDYRWNFTPFKLGELEANRWKLLFKHYSRGLLFTLLPGLILADLSALAYSALRGPTFLRAKLRSYLHVWQVRHHVLEQRAQIATTRVVGDAALLRLLSPHVLLRQQLGKTAGIAGEVMLTPLFAIPYVLARIMALRRRA